MRVPTCGTTVIGGPAAGWSSTVEFAARSWKRIKESSGMSALIALSLRESAVQAKAFVRSLMTSTNDERVEERRHMLTLCTAMASSRRL